MRILTELGKMSETFLNRIENLASDHLLTFNSSFDKSGYSTNTGAELGHGRPLRPGLVVSTALLV